MNECPKKIIHIAKIFSYGGSYVYLFLQQMDTHHYQWFSYDKIKGEAETAVIAATVELAIRKARSYWREEVFTTLHCGFRYTLPERDEHGMNAYFHQMAASYMSMNGIYFDDELGHNCFVQNASDEAKMFLSTFYGTRKS